jgi:hypothetical protein
MAGRIPDEVDFPALFLPQFTVRHRPDLVCGMLRIMHMTMKLDFGRNWKT